MMLQRVLGAAQGALIAKGMVVAGLLCGLASSTAHADPIFRDDFNGYVGNHDAFQAVTGLPVAFNGTLPGWTKVQVWDDHAIHAVARAPGNWALMFINQNTIVMNTGVAANTAGVPYVVRFEAAPADYRGGQGTRAGMDVVRFQVLNPSSAVVASFDYFPGNFPTSGTNPFSSAGFTYLGDGSGDVRLRIFDNHVVPASPYFGGAIDNLSISEVDDDDNDDDGNVEQESGGRKTSQVSNAHR